MKAGLATSVVLHAALIGFGLFSLSSPRQLAVADVEAFPVDIVPVESITQIQEGDKKAVKKEHSAPIPSKKPDIVPDARKVGEADVDTDKKPTPEARPKPVEAQPAPAPSPEPSPRPDPEIAKEPVKEPEQKPAAAPATEQAAVAQPKQEVKPDPVAETIVAETPDAEQANLPETAPTPQARPKQPQAETAKAPERKETEKPVVKEASKPSDEKEYSEDEVAALLSKEKPSGGGADRSHDEAALGGEKKTTGTKLTQSERDALRGQIARCWNYYLAGATDAQNMIVVVRFNLTPAGEVDGSPEIVSGGGSGGTERAVAESARRAVLQCGPYTLPADKYGGDAGWNQVEVTFDPKDMF